MGRKLSIKQLISHAVFRSGVIRVLSRICSVFAGALRPDKLDDLCCALVVKAVWAKTLLERSQ